MSIRAKTNEVRDLLQEIENICGFGQEEVKETPEEYDQLAADLETLLDTLMDEVSGLVGSELTLDELLASYIEVPSVKVMVENVKAAAALSDALGSRCSFGDRTSALLEGPAHSELQGIVDALERVWSHLQHG